MPDRRERLGLRCCGRHTIQILIDRGLHVVCVDPLTRRRLCVNVQYYTIDDSVSDLVVDEGECGGAAFCSREAESVYVLCE